MAAPGVAAADIDVSVQDATPTVTGGTRAERREEGGTRFRSERRCGRVQRSVRLPPGADPDAVAAETGHGVPALSIPRRSPAASGARRIPAAGRGRPRRPPGLPVADA